MARSYAPELKAAVMAALLAGQSTPEIAEEYSVPEGTVRSWKSRQGGTPVARVATEKSEEIGDLLLDYLRVSLRTLKTQVEHFGDKSWLASQDASELAVLHGVQTDKAIRLLEALSGGADEQ